MKASTGLDGPAFFRRRGEGRHCRVGALHERPVAALPIRIGSERRNAIHRVGRKSNDYKCNAGQN